VLDDRPAHATGPASQAWTRQAGDALREAAAAVRAARAGNRASLDPALLAGLRHSYDQAVAFGISVNLSRSWHKGKPPRTDPGPAAETQGRPGLALRHSLRRPGHEQRIGERRPRYKLAAKISGCWRTLATLQRHCRIRSYLTTARSHGRHPLAAIRDALNGTCWIPPTQHDQLTRHP